MTTSLTGVVVVPWPDGMALRARARAAGSPRLLVVASGAPPPTDCDRDEDWTFESATPADLALRAATLAARPSPARLLSPAIVARLSDGGVAVFDVLDRRRGHAVADGELAAAAGSAAELERAVRSLRRHLRPAGYDVLRRSGSTVLVQEAVY